ncbi:hypothetical protein H0H87_004962 [Tephrocybe sp. NHM501043]|nr:hypothetical protein H0H87_004962 [Tephrocybe sp. NHM501043]
MANARAGSSQRVLVSFSAAPSIVASPKWQQVQTALRAQLPLRNIHWKPASHSSIRTIQELDVDLVPLDTPRDEHTQIPVTILEKPLLNIYVIVLQNTDVEGYRATVKKQIKDWHSDVTARRNQEWLVVHITRPDSRAPTANLFQLRGSVLEKIRADFNTERRERCVQVAWSPEIDAPAIWAELINRIKDGIMSAFDLAESLASSFEGVNLFEDAYGQYEELETTFYHVLKEKNLSWFGTLITPTTGDDSAPLLSGERKAYRELILANTISVFDFRIYLLSRQCELLAQRGRITFSFSGPILNSFNAAKGELLDLARTQLDVIGVTAGHLPRRPPFSSTCNPLTSPAQTSSTLTITNTELLAAIKDAEAFYKLYLDATNRAIELYTTAGRRKFALRLHGSLAALDLHRGEYKTALSVYMSLPAHYAPHMWTALEAFMLSNALDTHTVFEHEKDMEWIHIVLSFLKSYVDNLGTDLLMHEEDKVEYISGLVESLHQAATRLDADLAHPNHSAASLKVFPDARIAETKDGCFLDVTVQNQLPCLLPVNEISVFLTGKDSEQCTFSTTLSGIPSGKTDLTLFCPAVTAGTYVLDSSELRMAKLCLQYQHRKPPSKMPSIRKELPLLVHIPKDLLALEVTVSQPNKIELGEPSTSLVAVSSGRNHVVKAIIKLASSGVTFRPKDAFYSDRKLLLNISLPGYWFDRGAVEQISQELKVIDNFIVLEDIPKHSVVTLVVPHSDISAFQAMNVVTEIQYTTVLEPSLSRTIRATQVVVTALPISVNVEDFFRGSRLFSKFTISTTSHQHVRICTAQLMPRNGGLDGVKISPTTTKNRGVVVESVVEESVTRALVDSSSPHQHRAIIINNIVKALENDAGWVDLYGITGEIKISRVPKADLSEEAAELLEKAKQLLSEHKHPYPPVGIWREIQIPVDVPYMTIAASACVKILATPFSDGSAKPGSMPLYAGQPISASLSIHTSFHWGSSVGDKERRYLLRYDVEEMAREWLVSGPKRGDFSAADGETNVVPITLIALHHGELALPKVSITALPMPGELTMGGSMAVPSIETSQIHGAETVLVLPRGGRTKIPSAGATTKAHLRPNLRRPLTMSSEIDDMDVATFLVCDYA